jgi:uncharacterized protein YjeT (DUF2065 family)
MAWAVVALGLVLVAEGLLWALAPDLVEDLLAALRALSREERRLAGLAALALGPRSSLGRSRLRRISDTKPHTVLTARDGTVRCRFRGVG